MDTRFSDLRAVVIKLTNRCNIRCKYCYESIAKKGDDMSSATFQSMIDTMLSSTRSKTLTLILHGGEPTILPTTWFAENLRVASALARRHDKSIAISIQSNMIDVDDEMLKIFHEHRVGIGASLDAPASIHDPHRPLAGKATATIKKALGLGISVGILSTINSSNIHGMRQFCGWLRDDLCVRRFKANTAYPVGAGIDMPVPEAADIFRAQMDILEFMLETRGAVLEDNLCWEVVRYFENHIAGVERQQTLCDQKRCGAGSHVVGVTPDGKLLPCGRFAWNEREYYLGDATTSDAVGSTVFSQRVDQFHDLSPENWRACDGCGAASVCAFGCQAFIVRSRKKMNLECEPTRLRFAYYERNVERIRPLYEYFCDQERRPWMSRLEQNLSKLGRVLPAQYRQTVHAELITMLTARGMREPASA